MALTLVEYELIEADDEDTERIGFFLRDGDSLFGVLYRHPGEHRLDFEDRGIEVLAILQNLQRLVTGEGREADGTD